MKTPIRVACALFAFGAASCVLSTFANTGECNLQGMFQSSLIFDWNNKSIWKDDYVPVNGDDVIFPTQPARTLTIRLPNGISLGTVTGTAGFYLKNPDNNTGSYSVSDASAFLGSWYFRNHNTLTLTDAATDTPVVNQFVSNGGPKLTTTTDNAKLLQLYGSGVLYKEGPGKLTIDNSSGASSVTVNGGEVEFTGVKTDLTGLDAVLAKAELHYDATEYSSLIFDTNSRVTGWMDLIGADQNATVATIGQGGSTGSAYPGAMYVTDYQNGNPVLDFGPYCDATSADPIAAGSTAMKFSRNVFTKAYFLVIADREQNPSSYQQFICDYEDGRWGRTATGGLFGAEVEPGTDVGELYVNGNRVLPRVEVCGTDLKVISYRSQIGRIGAYCPIDALAYGGARYSGGIRVGEVIRFNTDLTDDEMALVTRYLMKKWIPNNGGVVRQLDNVVLNSNASNTIGVSGDGTFVAKHLFASSDTLVKTGSGALALDAVSTKNGVPLNVDVQEGTVFFNNVDATTSQIAADPLYHFDASTLTEADGTELSRWEDVRGGDHAAMVASVTTFAKGNCALPKVMENAQNGLKVVDFGDRVCVGDASAQDIALSAGSNLDPKPAKAMVKEGFYVAKKKTSYNTFPLGSTDNIAFHPGDWGVLLNQTYGDEGLLGGFWTVDGNPVDPCVVNTASDNMFHLVHFASANRIYFNTFAWDRISGENFGGVQMGEAVLYDRELTTAERIATEKMLLAKWFNKSHPQASPTSVNLTYGNQVVSPKVGGEGNMNVGKLSAEGVVEKVGSGAMTVGTLAGATALAVSSGSLTVNNPLEGVLAKAALHLDASDSDSITITNDEQYGTYVSAWRDVRANGHVANAFTGSYYRPLLSENACNGKPVVNFGTRTDWTWMPYYSDNRSSGMEMDTTFKVKEAIIAYRQNHNAPYPFILTCRSAYDFHRSDDGKFFNTTYAPNFKDEKFYLDLDEKDNNYSHCDTDYHVLAIKAKTGTFGNVNSLCIDRSQTIGGNSYGEVLLFEQELTDVERNLVRNYLLKKWKNLELDLPVNSFASLSAAKDASLTLGYENVNVSALAGSGSIDGNVTLAENGTITAHFATDGTLAPLTMTGDLSLPEVGKIIVNSDAEKLAVGVYPLIVSEAITAKDVSSWTVESPATIHNSFSVHCSDGQLTLSVNANGIIIFVR